MALSLHEDDLNDRDVLAGKLVTLAEIVVRKHFFASQSLKEDLVQVGVLRSLELIELGVFDSSKGNLATFLYTGMRNSMQNFLYYENKNNAVGSIDDHADEVYQDDRYFEDEARRVSFSLVHLVCMAFTPAFGDVVEHLVEAELREMGYSIVGKAPGFMPGDSVYSDFVVDEYGERAEEDIVSRIIAIILWRKRQHEG